MTNIFASKELAEAELKKQEKNRRDIFCPDIGKGCKITCICYEAGSVHMDDPQDRKTEDQGPSWWIANGKCKKYGK